MDSAQHRETQRRAAPTEWLGDEAAMAGYRASMLRRALAIVKNVADAEDAVQEALERAWRSHDRFVSGAHPGPWLLKITTNVALDVLRGRRPVASQTEDTFATLGDAEDGALQRETVRSIGAALANLAPAHRMAFVLHDVHGYSNREISLQAQLPYHTVRTHLFRARREMRRALCEAES